MMIPNLTQWREQSWRKLHPALLTVAALLLSLASTASPVWAQDQPCLPASEVFLEQQLLAGQYAVGCLPESYLLFDAQANEWVDGPDPMVTAQGVQQDLFKGQVQSGQFDDYVIGQQPTWQTSGPLTWERDFAVMGPRPGSQTDLGSASQLFVLSMWLQMPLDLESYVAALQSRSSEYERIELQTLHLRYLDGDTIQPPQTGYILDGTQMQNLFQLDSIFINNRYVVVEPDLTAPLPTGLPVLTFFSGTPITSAEMLPLLDGLRFRRNPLPAQPSLAQVTSFYTPTGLLRLVPNIESKASAFITAKSQVIEQMALDFATEFPINHLLPFQLVTADTNLYWAPGSWQTGRLLLWEYTGGAHGNLNVGAWTFDDSGNLLSLADFLVWDDDAALEAIVQAALEYRQIHDQLGKTAAELEETVREGLPNLEAVSAWNPVIRNGATGLWVTLLPYTIAAYVDGVQEFFVPMPLTPEN